MSTTMRRSTSSGCKEKAGPVNHDSFFSTWYLHNSGQSASRRGHPCCGPLEISWVLNWTAWIHVCLQSSRPSRECWRADCRHDCVDLPCKSKKAIIIEGTIVHRIWICIGSAYTTISFSSKSFAHATPVLFAPEQAVECDKGSLAGICRGSIELLSAEGHSWGTGVVTMLVQQLVDNRDIFSDHPLDI